MQKKFRKKTLSSILCIALVVAMALFTAGCSGKIGNETVSSSGTETNFRQEGNARTEADTQIESDAQTESDAQIETETPKETDTQTAPNVLGEGDKQFTFTVVDKEGGETQFEIHTDKETVGEALIELGLIDGEKSVYGIFVKTVNGITADYDKDGVYWAFYVNEEYAQTGVDATEITDGYSYSFKVE